jgi:hypothetical protein
MNSPIKTERIRVIDYVKVPGSGICLPRIRYAYRFHTNTKPDMKYLDKSDINQEEPSCKNPDHP